MLEKILWVYWWWREKGRGGQDVYSYNNSSLAGILVLWFIHEFDDDVWGNKVLGCVFYKFLIKYQPFLRPMWYLKCRRRKPQFVKLTTFRMLKLGKTWKIGLFLWKPNSDNVITDGQVINLPSRLYRVSNDKKSHEWFRCEERINPSLYLLVYIALWWVTTPSPVSEKEKKNFRVRDSIAPLVMGVYLQCVYCRCTILSIHIQVQSFTVQTNPLDIGYRLKTIRTHFITTISMWLHA